jgi:spermidine synthase
MKPWKTLDTAPAGDGKQLVLQERDGTFVIRVGGVELMSSARHGSEDDLARAGLSGLSAPRPRVLVGGLGMGYTLKAALELVPADSTVLVAEISEAVVRWNRGPLAGLAGAPLEDPRVVVEVIDIGKLLAKSSPRYHAILLDVDNGPSALSRKGNQQLYGAAGLKAFHQALAPGGRLVVWSAGPDARFADRLRAAGFHASERQVAATKRASTRHTLFIATR